MVEIKKILEAMSLVGKQGNSLRITIPKEVRTLINVKDKDQIKWIIEITEKPDIKLEIIKSEDEDK